MIWICIKWQIMEVSRTRIEKTIKIDLYVYHLATNDDQRPNYLHIILCKILNKYPIWLWRRLSNWFLRILTNEFRYRIGKSLIDLFSGHRNRFRQQFHKLIVSFSIRDNVMALCDIKIGLITQSKASYAHLSMRIIGILFIILHS